MDKEEKCLKENPIFKGHIISVYNDDVLSPSGRVVKREYIKHPGGVCCLSVKDGFIYFVSQFRYPYHKNIIELPAGKLEIGEKPDEAIKRELVEEVGLYPLNMTFLGYIYPSVGYTDEILYLYCSTENEIRPTHPDEDEFLDIQKLTIEEAYKKLENGEIHDAKTICAMEMARKVIYK